MSRALWNNIAHFESATGLSQGDLREWVGRMNSLIGICTTDKRTFYPPREPLMSVLRTINKSLQTYKLPNYFYGTPKGVSQVDNAKIHASSEVMYKLDIKKFFPSIHHTKVRSTFERLTPDRTLSNLLTRLCTHAYHLPQGFPTSPRLAEITLVPLAKRLYRLCQKNDFRLSIYMDDIVLSGDKHLFPFKEKVMQIFAQFGFVLNMNIDKTNIDYLSSGFVVTGVLLDGNGLKTKPSFDDTVKSLESEIASIPPFTDSLVTKKLLSRLQGRKNWASLVQRENDKLQSTRST